MTARKPRTDGGIPGAFELSTQSHPGPRSTIVLGHVGPNDFLAVGLGGHGVAARHDLP